MPEQAAPQPRSIGASTEHEVGEEDVGQEESKPSLEIDEPLGTLGNDSPLSAHVRLWSTVLAASIQHPGKERLNEEAFALTLIIQLLEFARLGYNVMTSWYLWSFTLLWLTATLGCWAATGETLLGNITGGVVESVQLAQAQHSGWSMYAHILGGSALWILGFVQVVCKFLRADPRLSFVHRWSGRLLLCLWAFVVGPTAAHLSLFVGVGKSGVPLLQLLMTCFAVAGLDTTLLAYYYFWRALQLARSARACSDEVRRQLLQHHGRAMTMGLACTMLIVYQRPLQLVFLAYRKVALSVLNMIPLGGPGGVVEYLFNTVLGYHASLSLTTLLFGAGLFPLLIDGPRSAFLCLLADARTEDERKHFFGTVEPYKIELYLWRMRLPVFLGLRALITAGWTADPAEAF